jgi:asparagine synthase (glutamine-hydrolysing)
MCGITGLVDLTGRQVHLETIKAMTETIKHRGPDGEGQWVHQNVGLGHTRLAVIDLSDAAAQPMHSHDGRYALVYNGEIYNYQEIRSELQAVGIRARTESDTEILLLALIEWKEQALTKLNGMFAFAFFDKVEAELLLARDRYGIKPLYYSYKDSYFSFGSEQKAIKSGTDFKSEVDTEALIEYLSFQNIFSDKTLEKHIKLLPAGHFLKIKSRNGLSFSVKQYWDYHFCEPEKRRSEVEYTEELDYLFQQAVKRTLVSDVEIGAYLSGGIDSGSIAALASRENNGLKTFTVGFDLSSASGIELNFDERSEAEALSALLGTEHYEVVLKAGDMEKSLKGLMFHLEEPRVGQSYPNYYASKLAGKWVKVVLSGAGGDELFGGYPWRYYKAATSKNFEEFIDGYYGYWQRLVDNKTLKKMCTPIHTDFSNVQTREIFKEVFKTHQNSLENPAAYVNHSLYFECKTFLQGLFIVEDKLSMAHGLETRLPFMDNDLVDFAMRLPMDLKVKNLSGEFRVNENQQGNKKKYYQNRTNDGKYLLRKVLEKYTSTEISTRTKQGFSSPDASWFRGESIVYVKRILGSKRNVIYDFIDFKTVSKLLEDHFNGSQNRRLLIWSLLSLSHYLDTA